MVLKSLPQSNKTFISWLDTYHFVILRHIHKEASRTYTVCILLGRLLFVGYTECIDPSFNLEKHEFISIQEKKIMQCSPRSIPNKIRSLATGGVDRPLNDHILSISLTTLEIPISKHPVRNTIK